MQLKTSLVVAAAVVSVALGALTQWLDPGPYVTGAVLVVLLAYGVHKCAPMIKRSPRFDPVPRSLRGKFQGWIFVGGLPFIAWVVAVSLRLGWEGWTGLIIGLPLVSWLVWIAATGVQAMIMNKYLDKDYRAAQLARRTAGQASGPPPPRTEAEHLRHAWRVMCKVVQLTGDYAYLQVGEPTKASDHCMVFPVRVPSKVAAQLAQQKADEERGVKSTAKSLAQFGPSSAMSIAIALGEATHTDMPSSWVEVQETPVAGLFHIIVLSREIMADTIWWENDETPTTVNEPCEVTVFKDGTSNRFKLFGNGLIAAMSQSGKTNFIMVLLLFLLRCTDTVVWVGGVRKQAETFLPLFAKYKNTRERLPIDFIVNGQRDTMEMILCLLRIIDYRTAQLDKSQFKKLFFFLDEFADVVEDTSIKGLYKNRWITPAQGVRLINRVGKSVYVCEVLATHRDTNSMLGNDGGDLKSGNDWTVGLRTNEPASLHRLFNNYGLETLVYQGEAYAARTGVTPRRGKARYVQEEGKPDAPYNPEAITVAKAGWSRRMLTALRQLTPGEQQAAGEFYLARHTTYTDELEDYLRFGPPEPDEQTQASPVGPQPTLPTAPDAIPITGPDAAEAGRQHALAIIAAVEQGWASGEQQAATPQATPAVQTVTNLAGARQRRGRPAAILRLLGEQPMTVDQLIERMNAEGDSITDKQLIYNALAKLRSQKLVESEEVDGEVIHRLAGAA